jgi:class 3 adenylate cyclase/tetratricopeptide (TPR) repeat protein/predicted ATPase
VVEAERKLVTVLFADVAGFTQLAETLDPEPLRDLLNDLFDRLVPSVERYGGTVDKFIGDCLMALFGAPRSHDDDAERALRAALEMRAALEVFNAERGLGLAVHIGINTGRVVAGALGGGGRGDYSVVGDDVNIARRLQETAAPGEILVGPRTHSLAGAAFRWEPAGSVNLRGRKEPVDATRVLGLRSAGERDCSVVAAPPALLAREVEVESIVGALRRLTEGRGGVILLSGEAGIGKTTLLAEMRRRAQGAGVHWLDAQPFSFGRELAYLPFKQMLEQDAGIIASDGQEVRFTKLAARLEVIADGDVPGILPYLANLAGLPVSQVLRQELESVPENERRRRLFQAVSSYFLGVAERTPLILALDDAHWLDESSLALWESLLPLTGQAPVLVCLAFRPRTAFPAASLRQVLQGYAATRLTDLCLAPLDLSHTEQLVRDLLGLEDVPQALLKKVFVRTGGNPLFIEEVVRHLAQSTRWTGPSARGWDLVAHAAATEVPETLEGLITARIDELPDDAKDLLGHASIIGPVFSRRMLEAFVETRFPRLESLLARLCRLQFLEASVEDGTPIIAFKHTLVREAVYERLLLRERKDLHLRFASAVEALYPDRTGELCALLAFHYTKAEAWESAQAYLMEAGARALSMAADTEAMWLYHEAFAGLLRSYEENWSFPGSEDAAFWFLERSDPYWQAGQLGNLSATVEVFYDRVVAGHGRSNARAAAAACVLAESYIQQHVFDKAGSLLEEHVTLWGARGEAAGPILTRMLLMLGLVRMNQHRYADAAELLSSAKFHEQTEAGRAGVADDIYTYLTSAYLMLGEPERCRQALDEVLALPQLRGAPRYWALLLNLSSCHLEAGEREQAAEAARACLNSSPSSYALSFAHSHLAVALMALGRHDEAEQQFAAALQLLEGLGLHVQSAGVLAGWAELRLRRGLVDDAESLAEQALTRMREFAPEFWMKPAAYFTLAGVALARERLDTAEAMLEHCRSSSQGIMPDVGSFSAELHLRRANLRRRQGADREASQDFERAAEILKCLGGESHPLLQAARAALPHGQEPA